jgi:hypothetical protein
MLLVVRVRSKTSMNSLCMKDHDVIGRSKVRTLKTAGKRPNFLRRNTSLRLFSTPLAHYALRLRVNAGR